MAKSPEQLAHEQWLGYIQPEGLVVSIPALLEARAHINQNFLPRHRALLDFLPKDRAGQPIGELPGFLPFAESILGWSQADIAGAPQGPALPDTLQFYLRDYGETLQPKYALRDFNQSDSDWLLLIDELPGVQDFDAPLPTGVRQWQASPQARFERLLRETKVPAGLLVNQQAIRLVYAPRGESSGFLTFRIPEMIQVAGRPLFAALEMLLSTDRLFSVEKKEQLPAILAASRKYQNVVSTRLAGQVMAALYELLRGFQAANDQSAGQLLKEVLAREPNQVYQGLLTVLLRLVFILFAEDRGLLSTDSIYTNHYGIGGLFERLRADEARYPDTMEQRFGAWAQLLTLFRLIYDGGSHGPKFDLPARRGYLFDPSRYAFLEGRQSAEESIAIPRISDGVLHRVLENLLILDGERLSYRNLDVEQIGSVYEAVMGFTLEVSAGPAIAITSPKKAKGGAPVTINLEELLQSAPTKRAEWLQKTTGQKLAPKAVADLKSAASLPDLLAALDRKIEKELTPAVAPAGSMIFQPSSERRRSGSHYTPRSLTSPIVEAALAPVLQQLGHDPTPEQILDLMICDPAMGSGAFLVETCRQLGEHLLDAWRRTDSLPPIPPDEDELLHARRVVAQRCLYGVDRNDMAVDLAKLSLWLATLAKEHPFTFLDHALRHGDSLVGFTTRQISYFDWAANPQQDFFGKRFEDNLELVLRNRAIILNAPDTVPYETQQQRLRKADEYLVDARLAGDLLAATFFSSSKPKPREKDRLAKGALLKRAIESITDLDADDEIHGILRTLHAKGVTPFHWELEFPEVFRRGGFDVMVGNPPFAGKNTITEGNAAGYLDWLKLIHAESHGNSDLAAHFFRRAFTLLKAGGCFGLIATNTIGQGDTRSTGLRWICANEGVIYRARKRYKWPGHGAAVVVSVVHVHKGALKGPYHLDGRAVDRISAYLFYSGGSEDPERLIANEGKSFIGSYVLGMGFTFDDTDAKGVASPVAEMHRLIAKDQRNAERIFPYIGGEEVNESPTHAHHRYVINFEDFPLRRKETGHSWFQLTEDTRRTQLREGIVAPDYPDAVAADWPDLLKIVEARVKGTRAHHSTAQWWHFERYRMDLQKALHALGHSNTLVLSRHGQVICLARVPAAEIFAESIVCFPLPTQAAFAVLQSRAHEVWVRLMGSTLEDRLRYTPEDCFLTFPFPCGFETHPALEAAGIAYYDFRAALMVRNNEGLTKTYNRFHDPGEMSGDIVELRRLHDAMDRALLNAYGWKKLLPICDFFPEFDDEDTDDEEPSRKKKRFRYRWPDEIRDDVLARLLVLNQEQYDEEALAGLHTKANGSRGTRRRKSGTPEEGPLEDQGELEL
jgi:N-6 DNA Methylase